MVCGLPPADWLLEDGGYDADWFSEVLLDMGITPCIFERKSRDMATK